MIAKPTARSRNLKILLGVTLGLAAALMVLLLFVPDKTGRSADAEGVLLYADGETRTCAVSVRGTVNTYAFEQNAPVFDGILLLDGEEIEPLYLTFAGDYAAPKSDAQAHGGGAVLTKELEIAAHLLLDGRDCLLLAPAPDEAAAQALLTRILANSVFARMEGWEAYRK